MLDLIGNPKDHFSRVTGQLIVLRNFTSFPIIYLEVLQKYEPLKHSCQNDVPCGCYLMFTDVSLKLFVDIRPDFFYFLVLGRFLTKVWIGGENKNKNIS